MRLEDNLTTDKNSFHPEICLQDHRNGFRQMEVCSNWTHWCDLWMNECEEECFWEKDETLLSWSTVRSWFGKMGIWIFIWTASFPFGPCSQGDVVKCGGQTLICDHSQFFFFFNFIPQINLRRTESLWAFGEKIRCEMTFYYNHDSLFTLFVSCKNVCVHVFRWWKGS